MISKQLGVLKVAVFYRNKKVTIRVCSKRGGLFLFWTDSKQCAEPLQGFEPL